MKYAVEHETNFYIGRAIKVTDNEVEIKFLHQVVKTFNWPLRSDIDIFNKRRIFCGLMELKDTGPFNIPSLARIERLFKYIRNENIFEKILKLTANCSIKHCFTTIGLF